MKAAIGLTCLVMALGLSGAYAADKASPPIFLDYLDLFGTSKSAKTTYYDGVETETVCMQLTSYCESVDPDASCSAYVSGYADQVCTPYNWLMSFACTDCHPDGYPAHQRSGDMTDILDSTTPVAMCIMTEQNSGELPLPDKQGVSIFGTFTAQCLIKDEKDSCHAPEVCDNTVVQVTGVIYYVDKVVRDGPETTSTDCNAAAKRRTAGGARRGHGKGQGKRAADKKAGVKSAPSYYRDDAYTITPPPATVTTAPAYVYVGTMSVASRHHAVKFDKGFFQYSYIDYSDPADVTDNVPYSTVSGLPHFKDDAAAFHFATEKARY